MDQALQSMIDNMPAKTGKSIEEWIKILRAKDFAKHSEAVNHLKSEYGIGHGYANTIVALSKKEGEVEEDLVSHQYEGKESLYPIYESLIKEVYKMGDDVRISPKKASVSIIRKHQFLLIKPATKTRIDLGFKLKNMPTGSRLEDSGPFGTMCSHRVKIHDISDIDEELLGWIHKAYEQSV